MSSSEFSSHLLSLTGQSARMYDPPRPQMVLCLLRLGERSTSVRGGCWCVVCSRCVPGPHPSVCQRRQAARPVQRERVLASSVGKESEGCKIVWRCSQDHADLHHRRPWEAITRSCRTQ